MSKIATRLVQPSTSRYGLTSVTNLSWEDVGGYDSLKKEFDRYIIKGIKHSKDYEEFGLDAEVGFLLYGPMGCGKALIAMVIANEAGANFIHIKAGDIFSIRVGEIEQELRRIFRRARTYSPCIILFDEVDALTSKQGKEQSRAVELFQNQLLIELDGLDKRHGVFVIGVTDRPQDVDPTFLRTGRFGRLFYVPLPNADEHALILKALARKSSISLDIDYNAFFLKNACKDCTGFDLYVLFNNAIHIALQDNFDDMLFYDKPPVLETCHLEKAFEKIRPSVSEEQRLYYEALSHNFRASSDGTASRF